MRLASIKICCISSAIFGAISLLTLISQAQDTDTKAPQNPVHHTFEEIILTDEGVIATDTSGEQWQYDFEMNSFVQSDINNRITSDIVPEGEWSSLSIEERCTEELIPKLSGSATITVQANQFVDGDIITDKRVTVKGWVIGNIESLDGRVLVGPTGQVDGDIVAPKIIIRDGATVNGSIIERKGSLDLDDLTASYSVGGVLVVISQTLFFLLISFLTISLAPEKTARFYDCFRTYKVRCFFTGFLTFMLMPIILVLIAITVVGILVIPLLPLAYILAGVLGLASFGNLLSNRLLGSTEKSKQLSLLPALSGIILFMLIWLLVSITMGSGESTTHGFGILFLVLSILISIYPFCTGIGAAVLTRFGFREYKTWHERQSQAQDNMSAPKPPPMRSANGLVPTPPPNRPFTPPSPPEKN